MNLFIEIFNEVEHLIGEQISMDPAIDTVIVPEHKRRKRKGKQDEDLMNFDTKIIEHTLTDAELSSLFPQGYRRLPDEVYKKLELIPAVFEVHEHHVDVYIRKEWKDHKSRSFEGNA